MTDNGASALWLGMDNEMTRLCKCGRRTLRHLDWCAPCGSLRPAPPPPAAPSNKPSIKDIVKKD